MTKPRLVLGTGNQKKGREMTALLAPVGLELLTLADVDGAIEVVEDGDSFAANAALKATVQAKHLQRWVLAEDSGLAVDYLDGAPGIYSARFSDPGATDASNNRLLLDKLADVPSPKRSAHYVCHMTLSDPQGNVLAESTGTCRGRIVEECRGTSGFGYDPLFEIVEYHKTFGQLGDSVKASLSHRARAARLLIPRLIELVDTGVFQ